MSTHFFLAFLAGAFLAAFLVVFAFAMVITPFQEHKKKNIEVLKCAAKQRTSDEAPSTEQSCKGEVE